MILLLPVSLASIPSGALAVETVMGLFNKDRLKMRLDNRLERQRIKWDAKTIAFENGINPSQNWASIGESVASSIGSIANPMSGTVSGGFSGLLGGIFGGDKPQENGSGLLGDIGKKLGLGKPNETEKDSTNTVYIFLAIGAVVLVFLFMGNRK